LVGNSVCRMQLCRAFPFAIWKDTACGPSRISCSVGLGAIRIRYSFVNVWLSQAIGIDINSRIWSAGYSVFGEADTR
jgi:hypothetical protein